MVASPTYFTCTLGQAAALDLQQPHKTINELVDRLADRDGPNPAVGFAVPYRDQAWSSHIFTFKDIAHGSKALARTLLEKHEPHLGQRTTVGLLSASTPAFLLTWLALIRLGHAVLLIAPQCAPSAISSLCEQCGVGLLLHDDSYGELAQEAVQHASEHERVLEAAQMSESSPEGLSAANNETAPVSTANVRAEDIAYLHHTSGTSTGIPKPIPQSHNAGVGVLPRLEDGSAVATFTTTPLYHGGVADLFRAWASSALIWLFPGKGAPITAGNVVKALDVASGLAEDGKTPPVKYFSSVPYVLQLLAGEERGLHYLQRMDMVGVGGAALPAEVGDLLVSQNINLLSRFGSAECGFLLSSHRDYINDKAWQYLRPAEGQRHISFEPRDDGLSELVVLSGWPHMAKRNREDGSYATSDLFEPHPEIENAWRYHSRSDSQLTLITGKKFDPAPLEADLAAQSELSDAIIFGSGKPYPGVLLFRSLEAQSLSDDELLAQLWPVVEKLNAGSQDHAKLSRSMLIPMTVLDEPLQKSSKGTLLRAAAEQRFAETMETAYSEVVSATQEEIKDADLPTAVEQIVRKVSHRKLDLTHDTDLFSAGVDSVAGMQIRSRLRTLLPKDKAVPMTIVEDCGSIEKLASWIQKKRSGLADEINTNDDHEVMLRLVNEYSVFHTDDHESVPADDQQTIVLTGATGALGAHILDQYRKLPDVRKIYCLVRSADSHAARERVSKVLQQRKLVPLERDDKIVILQSQLDRTDLGLDEQTYQTVAREVTAFLHVAWSVNFRMRLNSFKDNLASVTNLINLALASPRRPIFSFCSSVASGMAHKDIDVPEELLNSPSSATSLGYSQSKWVAEQICARAETTALHGRVGIFRVGQLAGDTAHGVWNASEAWPIMLSSATSTHCLPALDNEIVDWLPVDIAAAALIEGTSWVRDHGSSGVEIFHVLNSHTRPNWTELTSWVQAYEPVEIVSPAAWAKQIEALEQENPAHPALKLLSHWQRAYGDHGERTNTSNGGSDLRRQFATTATQARIPVLQTVEPVSQAYFGKLWQWIQHDM